MATYSPFVPWANSQNADAPRYNPQAPFVPQGQTGTPQMPAGDWGQIMPFLAKMFQQQPQGPSYGPMDAARAVTQIRGGGQRDINGYLSTGDPLLDQQRHDQVWNNTFKTAQQRATRESEMLGIPYDQTFTARQMADQSSGKFFRPDAIGQARRDPLRDIPMGPAPVQYETLPFNQKAWEAKNPQMNAAIRNEVYDSFKLPNSGFSRRLPVRSRGVNPLAAFFGMFNR